MKIIGLTSGIARGKSTVTTFFAELGVPIIDEDIIAHQLVAKEMPALESLKECFGASIIQADGYLNHSKMCELMFAPPIHNNPHKKAVELTLHPLIFKEIQNQLDALTHTNPSFPYCMVIIPLLIETWSLFKDVIEKIVVIGVCKTEQLQRLLEKKENSFSTSQEALARIESQASPENRLEKGNTLISNTGDLPALKKEVERLQARWSMTPQ